MTALPPIGDFTNPAANEAQIKAWMTAFRESIAGVVGTAGTPAAARTQLGLVIGADVQAHSAILAALAGLSPAADRLAYFTGASALGLTTLSAFGRNLIDDADAAAARTTLGLGTAATAAATTGATDTTAGRVTRVGDFGLGQTGAQIDLADFNATTTPAGQYRTTAATANLPAEFPHPFGTITITRYNADVLQQEWLANYGLGTPPGPAQRWYRTNGGTGWQPWQRTIHSRNLIQAVAQSGGVPTGGVFEPGSNANGRFRRTAEGVLECWHTVTTSSSAGVTWTFPAAFVEPPVIEVTAVATVLAAGVMDAAPGTTSAVVSVRGAGDVRLAVTAHLRATGRWSTMT